MFDRIQNMSVSFAMKNLFIKQGLATYWRDQKYGVDIYEIDVNKIVRDNIPLTTKQHDFIITLVNCGGAFSMANSVILSNSIEEGLRKFFLYHEIGHIIHGDLKLSTWKYIKAMIHKLFTGNVLILTNKEKELAADAFAVGICGYSPTLAAVCHGVVDIVEDIIGLSPENKMDMYNCMENYLRSEGRFQ